MSTPFEIRAARPGDTDRLVTLLTELNRSEGFDITPDRSALFDSLFAPGREVNVQVLVAEVAGEVVALLLYYPGYDSVSSASGFHLADIVVHTPYKRRGIGRALFTALAAQALAEKKQWVSLTMLRGNDVAKEFYNAFGMTLVDINFFAIGEIGLTAVINAK